MSSQLRSLVGDEKILGIKGMVNYVYTCSTEGKTLVSRDRKQHFYLFFFVLFLFFYLFFFYNLFMNFCFQINSILLIFLLRRIHRATKTKNNKTSAKHVKDWLRRFAMLLPVLGVTWSFGFLTFITSTAVFHYIFTILNSFQGLFIFVSFCILDDSVSL